MIKLAYSINGFVETFLSFFLWPFQSLEPVWGLVFISFLTGVSIVWGYKLVSNQSGIVKARDKIRGNLIGIRLYQHDLQTVLRLQLKTLKYTLRYMGYSLLPMLVLSTPMMFLLIQLNYNFSFRPFFPEEVTLLKATFKNPDLLEEVNLEVPSSVVIETLPVNIPSLGEIAWRIRLKEAGQHFLKFHVGNQIVNKELYVGTKWQKVSPLKSSIFSDVLFYYGEEPFPHSFQLSKIEVIYPSLSIQIFGWELHWLWVFFVVSLGTAFVCKRPLGVAI